MPQPDSNRAATYPIEYFIDGQYLGQGRRSWEFFHNQPIPPESKAFFCEHCGEVWARVVSTEGTKHFAVYSMGCAKCRNPYRFMNPPGSIWMDWDKDWQDAMPKAVLQRELRLHCEFWLERNRE